MPKNPKMTKSIIHRVFILLPQSISFVQDVFSCWIKLLSFLLSLENNGTPPYWSIAFIVDIKELFRAAKCLAYPSLAG